VRGGVVGRRAAPPTEARPRRGRGTPAVAGVVVAILIAGPSYAFLGSPDLPGEPIASRGSEDELANSITALIARIEAHLEAEPTDGRGWEVIAPVYMKLGRYDDAVKARRNALSLLGSTAQREVDLGEALAMSAGGVVTAESKAAFER